jgi:TPR repeat protein
MRPSERDPHLAEMWLPFEEAVELPPQDPRALAKLEEALAAGERLLGEDSPYLYPVLEGLQLHYLARERHEDAVRCGLRMIRIAPSGAKHPDTGKIMANTAEAYRALGQHEEALHWDLQNMVTQMAALGRHHPDTVDAALNVAADYLATGDRSEARDYLGIVEREIASGNGIGGERAERARACRRQIESGGHGVGGTFPEYAADQEAKYRAAITKGDTAALCHLGTVLEAQGRTKEAEECYRRSAGEGNVPALGQLGFLLWQTGRARDGERCLRAAAEAGEVHARCSLGMLLAADKPREAEPLLRLAAEAGLESRAAWTLARVLERLNRSEEAETWYRKAAEAGDTEAMVLLGLLLARRGQTREAERWLRKAADAGEASALGPLGSWLLEGGRATEAEPLLLRAAEGGDVVAMMNLGHMYGGQGRMDEVERWVRRAAEAGDPDAVKLVRRITGASQTPAPGRAGRGRFRPRKG